MVDVVVLTILIFLAAVLYSSVGHAGASGYLAAMGLMGLAPDVMKPTALFLNIIVAAIGSFRFVRAGHFAWPIFWPFAIASIPLSFVGGAARLPYDLYKAAVGAVLLFAAFRLVYSAARKQQEAIRPVPVGTAMVAGGCIGLLSGLTGVGGGIFLSPLLLLARWAEMRQTAAVSVVFILVNSMAGLAGNLASVQQLPAPIPLWAAAAAIGGLIGSELGSRRAPPLALKYTLCAVLVVAGLKMIFV